MTGRKRGARKIILGLGARDRRSPKFFDALPIEPWLGGANVWREGTVPRGGAKATKKQTAGSQNATATRHETPNENTRDRGTIGRGPHERSHVYHRRPTRGSRQSGAGKMIRFLAGILLILLFGGTHAAYSQGGGGSLGMRVGEVTDAISRAFGLTEPHGAIVYSIDETGPARSADIQPGELITKFNDRNVREYREFAELVSKAPAGTHVNLTIVRLGQEQIKTVTIRAPAPSIRTPECEEYVSITYSPMKIQALFGKLAGDMTLADLDQADAVALHCWKLAQYPTDMKMQLRSLMPSRVAQVRIALSNAKRAQLEGEKRAFARDQAIFQSRLEEERKNTDTKAKVAASAAQAKARADECRNHCRQKLLAILDKLHSLKPNAASIELIRELRRDHQALVQQMPPDVSAILSALNDSFVAEYKTAEVKALADEYRQKLVALLEELRSLGTDQLSIERFRELDRRHKALIQQTPRRFCVTSFAQ